MFLDFLPRWVWWLAIAHVLVLAGICGAWIVGEDFSVIVIAGGPELDQTDEFGIFLAMFAIVTAPLAAAMSVIAVGASDSLPLRVAVSFYNSIAGVLVAAAAMAFSVRPADTFSSVHSPDNVQQLLGGMVFAIAIPYVITTTCVAIVHARGKDVGARLDPRAWLDAARGEEFLGPNALLIMGGVATIAAATFLCCILSAVMNFGPASYFTWVSPFSLVQNVQWTWGVATATSTQPLIVPKVYEDVVVYFSVVTATMLLGVAGTYWTPARRWLHTRLRMPLLKTLRLRSTGDVTLGEIILSLSFWGLFVYWILYWTGTASFATPLYNRIVKEAQGMNGPGAIQELQVIARVLGHVTTLFMSFITFPVTKTSVWTAAFGVPVDQAIQYHRVLGGAVWVAVTLHMVVWQIKWAAEGTLWHNVVAVNNLIITAQPSNNPVIGAFHYDNFTIPIAELSWLLLTVALAVALFCRRSRYFLFQVTHQAALFFFFAAIMHAWTHWYYAFVGLALYTFDRLLRTASAARAIRVLRVRAAAGVTEITVRATDVLGGSAPHFAGQFAYVNLPGVHGLQWHPFTISSAPHDAITPWRGDSSEGGALTFHVRSCGSWTRDLYVLARAACDEPPLPPPPGGLHRHLGESTYDDEEDGAAAGLTSPALASFIEGFTPSGDKGGVGGGATVPLLARNLKTIPDGALNSEPVPPVPAALSAISIDGPYGRMPPFGRHRTVILFAGGIGITPLLSIASDVLARWSDPPAVRAVLPIATVRLHLVWTVRDAALLAVFADRLAPLLLQGGGQHAGVEAHLHVTGRAADDHIVVAEVAEAVGCGMCSSSNAKAVLAAARPGRPDLQAVCAAIAATEPDVAASCPETRGAAAIAEPHPLAMVCGPPALSEQVSELCFAHGWDFHAEAFEL